MPERRDSIDSFDDFFGEQKKTETEPIRKPSPAPSTPFRKSKNRPPTPPTPEERVETPWKIPTKSDRTAAPVKSPPPPPESVHSNDYESDFDDVNDDETAVRSAQPGQRVQSRPVSKDQRRRGSDSELKSSYSIAPRRNKSNNEKTQRRGPLLPSVRPTQTRRPLAMNPINRRPRDSRGSSTKDQDAADKRILSAQHEKLKGLESQIALLQREIENQRIENATLRKIQRQEEKAIKKYEEKEYDIHRIIRDYNQEIEHIKHVLENEREKKTRLEKQIEARDEKLRDQSKKLKQYEKIVQEKHLDERYELKEKLNEVDKKLKEYEEKLVVQERHIEHLEKNHRHEIKQELAKQKELKRELEKRMEKYNELKLKLEEKTRQAETMHIYARREPPQQSGFTSNLSKSHSLQSLDVSPRNRKRIDEQDRKRQDKAHSSEKKKAKEEKPPAKPADQLPPKSKPPLRRLSTPESVEEEKPIKSTMQRNEDYIGGGQVHKPSTETKSQQNGGPASSIFKLTEPPPVPASKPRPKRDLDEKWSEMFGSNQKEDSAKEDLLSKLVADEQQERRTVANQQRSSMTTFEPSTRSTQPTTTAKPSADPFASLFGNSSSNNRPAATRTNPVDDIFSTKPSSQAKPTTASNDPFESLFGSTSNTTSSNDKLSRPKVANNGLKAVPNRTIFDEMEEFA